MPCSKAMITNVITARPEQTVADALVLFDKHRIRAVPVVDKDNKLVGLYGFAHLLLDLMPFAVDEDDKMKRMHGLDISLDALVESSSWLDEQMGDLLGKSLSEVMIKNPHHVLPDTGLHEGIRLLAKFGSPLPVVKSKSDHTLVGLISSQAMIKVLLMMKAGK